MRHTTLIQKQQFLRSKGLTAHEIQLACERAGVFTQDPNKPNPNPNTVISIGSQLHALQPQPTVLGRIREIIHSAALFSGVVYAVYIFWKVRCSGISISGSFKKIYYIYSTNSSANLKIAILSKA